MQHTADINSVCVCTNISADDALGDRGRPDLYGDNRSNAFLAREVKNKLGEDHVLQPGTHYDFSFGENPCPDDVSERYATTTGDTYSVSGR